MRIANGVRYQGGIALQPQDAQTEACGPAPTGGSGCAGAGGWLLSEHQLRGNAGKWPVILVPGWGYLEPGFRDELAGYAKNGGKLVLIGDGPARLFEQELGQFANITVVKDVDDAFPEVLQVTWADGYASAKVPKLRIYAILAVTE